MLPLESEIYELLSRQDQQRDISADPIRFPKRYSKSTDQVIIAFFAASLAYGRVHAIGRAVEDVCARIGHSPTTQCMKDCPASALSRFKGFKYRFTSGAALARLWVGLGSILREHEDFSHVLCMWDSPESSTILPIMQRFRDELHQRSIMIKDAEGFKHLIPDPSKGSAMKRMCLLFRWLVRGPDEVDLGHWSTLGTQRLVIPLDVHVFRLSRALGLTNRSNPNLDTALEVTKALQRFDHEDPIRFDFALAHLGISGDCKGYRVPHLCEKCPLTHSCTL